MKHPVFDPEERIFTLGDILRLFKTLRKKLLFIACFFGLLGGAFQLTRKPIYLIEATFKEGVEKSDEGGLKDLLGGFGMNSQQPQAIVLMKSHRVLRPLIEQFGLQLSVPSGKFFENLRHQWTSERGGLLKDPDEFLFSNVQSSHEQNTGYALRFTDLNSFELLDDHLNPLAQGRLGEPVHVKGLYFTCQKVPSTLQLQTIYPLHVAPWINTVEGFKKSLKIVSHKANKSIYDLTLEHRDRQRGASLLNGLMEEYQNYLKKEHDQVASEQIAYLEEKQAQIYEKMGYVFDEHAAYLKDSLKSRGFIGLEEGMESFVATHENLRNQIFAIDVELGQLENEPTGASCLGESPFAKTLFLAADQSRALEQQRDLLELALQNTSPPINMETLFGELSSIRREKKEVEQLCSSFAADPQRKLPSQLSWAASVQPTELTSYLSHHLHLLNLQEKLLQERLIYPVKEAKEFQGIDLESSRDLYVEYTTKLDGAEAAYNQLEHLKQQIEQKEVEFASLGGILQDTFSQQLIQQASKTAHLLKDENHRTEKELQRWTEELEFQKKVLCQHIDQLKSVEQLKSKLMREKMISLQSASLQCIHQELSIAQEKCRQLVQQRKQALHQEKELLTQKMDELRLIGADLPERWKLEHWLKLKTEMGTKVMSVMTELVESKTISRHLHHVESKPLDRAVAPVLAKKPKLLETSFLFAFGAAFAFFFISLLRNLLKGFPLSPDKLQAVGYPYSGVLQEGGLETLRRLSFFIASSKIVALIGGQGPNYSTEFARNIARSGRSVLLIDCAFDQENSPPGLLEWLEQDLTEIPIQKEESFHTISSGGRSSFGVELLRSDRFNELLSKVKSRYDIVLLWQKSSLNEVDALSSLSLVDKAVVTVSNEPTEWLTPFIKWAYHEENCRLTFVATL